MSITAFNHLSYSKKVFIYILYGFKYGFCQDILHGLKKSTELYNLPWNMEGFPSVILEITYFKNNQPSLLN